MIGSTVLDASVVVKWFRQGEALAREALALRTAYLEGRIRILVPTLLAYEVANVLRHRIGLTASQVEVAVQSLFDMGLEWAPPSAAMIRRAVAIAQRADTTVYDATYAALAELVGATYVTGDERLARRLANLRFVRFLGNLEEEEAQG